MKNDTMQAILAARKNIIDNTTLVGEEIPLVSSLRPLKEGDLEEFKSSMEYWMSMSPEERRKVRMENYTKDRDDLMTPSKLTAAYICSNAGTDLDAIEPFTTELTGIVEKMKEELANEVRILEGTEVPEYKQNELSEEKISEEEWKTFLQNGSLRTVRTLTSIPDLSTSSCSVRHNSPVLDILGSVSCSCPLQTPSCPPIWADCGCVTDAMNESSECTVPMISEQTPGTPSEVK